MVLLASDEPTPSTWRPSRTPAAAPAPLGTRLRALVAAAGGAVRRAGP